MEDDEVYLTLEEAITEVARILDRIRTSEDFIARAEAFYKDRSDEWIYGVGPRVEIILERKREQVQIEKALVEKIGLDIALGKYPQDLEN